jgi:hypothetical protein
MMFWLKDLHSTKGLIKYYKVNGIIHMTIHVQIARPRLFAQRNQQLNQKVVKHVVHVR